MWNFKLEAWPDGQEIPAFRLQVRFLSDPSHIKVTARGAGESTSFHFASDQEGGDSYMDVSALRDAFERVENEQQALTFLENCGSFEPTYGNLPWSRFRKWQRYFHEQRMRRQFKDSPEGAKLGEAHGIVVGRPTIDMLPDPPLKAWIDCNSVVEAIAAANFVDLASGVEARECLECGYAFTPPTKRRWYCSQRCTDRAGREGKRIDGAGRQFDREGKEIARARGAHDEA